MMPDIFSGIDLRFPDRPDLECGDIGVEVTNCNINNSEKETENIFYRAIIKNDMGVPIESEIKLIEKKEQTVQVYSEGLSKTMNSFERVPDNYLLNPFLIKLNALNNGYTIFSKNTLFLIVGSNNSYTYDNDLIEEFAK